MKVSLVIFGSRTAAVSPTEISRHVMKWSEVVQAFEERDAEVVSGMARGVDMIAVHWARRCGYPLVEMPADWTKHGKGAGHIRNRAMAVRATHGLGFWHGESGGTANMTSHLVALGKPVRLVEM